MLCIYFKNKFKLQKTNNSLNSCKWRKRRLTLSCCKKTLLRRITSKHYRDFCFLNDHFSSATKNKLESAEKLSKKKDFCGIALATRKKYFII